MRGAGPGRTPWHAEPVSNVFEELGTDPEQGLASAEAESRLERSGPNRLEARGRTPWQRVFLRQFGDVLIAILAVAALVSLAIGEVLDAAAILAILIVNGLLGFVQEWRAERALAALQGMLSLRSTVLRDGAEAEVDAEKLVPGDVVLLAGGKRVPADLRIFAAQELEVDESALTGESLSVSKDPEPLEPKRPLAERSSMSWMGTVVASGSRPGSRRGHRHDDRVRPHRGADSIGRA